MSTHAEPAARRTSAPTRGAVLQRCPDGRCTPRKCAEHRQAQLQRSSNDHATSPVAGVPPVVHQVLRDVGRPLDGATRADMEGRFGHDFARVRVHEGPEADRSARTVDALAYTAGRHIVLSAALAARTSAERRHVLAHELAHVVQQGGAQAPDTLPASVGTAGDHHEVEADTVARDIMRRHAGTTERPAPGPGDLRRLGPNPDCTPAEQQLIHQAIFNARGWLGKAIAALAATPLSTRTLQSLQRNFGPTYGVAVNADLIRRRLIAARSALGTMPITCAGAADPTCAAGHCGHAVAGANAATVCTNSTLTAGWLFQAGCVLHEAFHATFALMNVDWYSGWHGNSSSTPGYPGAGLEPLLNADSYTTLVMDLS